MNITYTGRHGELPPDQQRKLDTKFAKLSKLVERKGADKGAHVVITTERHLTNAEVTMNFYDHSLVGVGAGPDLFTAVSTALEKAEKQALKIRTKWRDTKRGPKDKSMEGVNGTAATAPAAAPSSAKKTKAKAKAPAGEVLEPEETGPQVFRVNHHERRKPIRSMRRCSKWTAATTWCIATRTATAYPCSYAAKTAISIWLSRSGGAPRQDPTSKAGGLAF